MQNNDVCVIAFQKMENMNLHFYCFAALLWGGGRGGVHVQTYESCVWVACLIAREHVKEVELSCSESRQDCKRGNSEH